MKEITLTNDADYLLCLMYEKYLERRDDGMDKDSSGSFGGAKMISGTLGLGWSVNDIADTCRELDNQGVLSVAYGDNTVIESILTNNGIRYMETRFERKVNKVLERIAQLKKILF